MTKKDIILGIGTTSKFCEVSLKINDKIESITINEGNVHSDRLVPLIDQILDNNYFYWL